MNTFFVTSAPLIRLNTRYPTLSLSSMRTVFFHHPYATRDEFTLMTFLGFGAVLFTIVTTAIYLYASVQ
jgi:hypothetical protein